MNCYTVYRFALRDSYI